jgi:hypothetical protein
VDGNPCGLGLVPQHQQQVANSPVPQTLVVPPPGLQGQHTARIANR